MKEAMTKNKNIIKSLFLKFISLNEKAKLIRNVNGMIK